MNSHSLTTMMRKKKSGMMKKILLNFDHFLAIQYVTCSFLSKPIKRTTTFNKSGGMFFFKLSPVLMLLKLKMTMTTRLMMITVVTMTMTMMKIRGKFSLVSAASVGGRVSNQLSLTQLLLMLLLMLMLM